jgi:hypothetical protein
VKLKMKIQIKTHHTELVSSTRTILEIEVSIRFGVVETGRDGADAVVELTALVALQAICRGDHND